MMDTLHTEFLAAFKTEADLRLALRTLFSKMPGVRDVQITHGTQEYGKDIVFYAPDFRQKMQLHACVVKLRKIDGSAKSTGAYEVVTQALQAFDTPHLNLEGQSEYVSRVFIISPYDCPPTTMRSIEGALKQRAGHITFLCGQLLVDEFSKYYQEFLLFNSSALNLYIASISRNILGKDPIHFLLKNHQLLVGELESLQKRYVPQGFKKSLQLTDCYLSPEVFSKRAFTSIVSSSDARRMAVDLMGYSVLLKTGIGIDEDQENAHGYLASKFEELGDAILERWNKLFDAQRREMELSGRKAYSRAESAFTLGKDLYQENESILQLGKKFADRLIKKIEDVNKLIDGKQSIRLKVQSPIYATVSEIQDLVRSAPGIFKCEMQNSWDVLLDKDALLNDPSLHLLITAPAGYGKTSFCKIHAIRDAALLEKKKTTRIPVYVSLHSLATQDITSECFMSLPEIRAVMESSDAHTLNWIFYLDGLDEIADPNQRHQLVSIAKDLLDKFPLGKIVITSRDYIAGTNYSWLTRVDLDGLGNKAIGELAGHWLSSEVDVSSFLSEVDKSRTLEKLLRVPLLATLTLAVFKKRKSLPSSKSVLYETFIDLLCGGWDYVKSVNRDSKYGRHEKIAILTRYAGILHFNKLRHGTELNLRTAVSDISRLRLETFSELLNEMIEDGLIQRSGGSILFGHLSFQEFLAARELGDPAGERNNVVLLDFLRGDEWWREVLAFYVSGPGRPDETERWLRKAAEKVEMSGVQCRARERFLLACMEDAFPGWEAKLLRQADEAYKKGR